MSKRTGIMLATMFTEKLFNKMPKPVYVQPKIEGDRLRVPIWRDNLKLLSSYGKNKVCVPHIYKELHAHDLNPIELDGELYNHTMRHSEIRSIVGRTKNLHSNYKKMEYHIFDIVNTGLTQHIRLKLLYTFFKDKNFKYLKLVPSHLIESFDELQTYYNDFLDQGYEGIIIRHAYAKYVRRKCTTILKLKPRVSEYFEVVGIEEECTLDGERKGVFGAFTLVTKEGNLFNVGSGPTDRQRALIWRYKSRFTLAKASLAHTGIMVKIRFQGYTKVRRVPKLLSIDKEWLKMIEKQLTKGESNENYYSQTDR